MFPTASSSPQSRPQKLSIPDIWRNDNGLKVPPQKGTHYTLVLQMQRHRGKNIPPLKTSYNLVFHWENQRSGHYPTRRCHLDCTQHTDPKRGVRRKWWYTAIPATLRCCHVFGTLLYVVRMLNEDCFSYVGKLDELLSFFLNYFVQTQELSVKSHSLLHPYPLFQWYSQSNEILLNLGMKRRNSAL
jgi:hypothetical protein